MNTTETIKEQVGKKISAKLTGRRYDSVAALMEGEGVSNKIRDRFEELQKKTRITRLLACMRAKAGLTQAEIAKQMGCTQGCISKWESGTDEELTLEVILNYCRVTNQRLELAFGKPMAPIEIARLYAIGLRDQLETLVKGEGDSELHMQRIRASFGEAFFELLDIVGNPPELPKADDVEIRMQLIQGSSQHSDEAKPETVCC